MTQQPDPGISTISIVLYRMNAIERDINTLKDQLSLYQKTNENDLKLQRVFDTIDRLEDNVVAEKDDLKAVNKEIVTVKEELHKIREEQNKIWIKILWGTITTIGSLIIGILLYLITHHLG